MSVGALPIPEEIDAIPGGDPNAPIPAPPGIGLTPEQLALAAVPKPVAFPDNPVDEALTQNSLNPPAPILEPPKNPQEQAERNVNDATKLGDEQIKNAAKKADIQTRLADEGAKFKDAHQKELERFTTNQEMHRQAAEKAVTEARAKAESAPYHTFWESRSNGQAAMIGVGLILNGISWNPQHENRGVKMLNDAMNNDLEIQRAKHSDLWRAVDEAQQGVKDLDQYQLKELSAFSANEGARWDAIAGRLGAAVAANKGKGDVSTAKKEALEASEKANVAWQNSITAAATANHLSAMDKERAEHDRAMEANQRKKKAGAEGSAGGGKLQENAVKLREEIDAAKKSGTPLTGTQIDRRALELKIPPVAKAGRISLKTIMDEVGKETTADNKALQLSDKDEQRMVRWHGKELGMAPKPSDVKLIAKDLANMEKYTGLIEELAADIDKNGWIIDSEHNPRREKAQHRMSLFAEVQALGRQISALQATDAGQKLEHQMIGMSGVGLLPGVASPKVLRELKDRAQKLVDSKIGSMLTPVKRTAGGAEGGGGKTWTAIPARYAEKFKGKTQMLVDSEGNALEVR